MGCQTYVTATGRRHRQLFPVTDKHSIADLDTTKYVLLPFDSAYYSNNISNKDKRRIIQLISARELKALASSEEKYLVYFWNPDCSGTQKNIRYFDSVAKNGTKVLVASLKHSYERMEARLRNTTFSLYPLYVVNPDKDSRRLTIRLIAIVKETCPSCYKTYRDDIVVSSHLYIANDSIAVVMHR